MKHTVIPILFLALLLCASSSHAVTIKNCTSRLIAGSVRFKGRPNPIFQFILQPYEKFKWRKPIRGDEFVLNAMPGKVGDKKITPVQVDLKNLNCYIEIVKDEKAGLAFEIDQ